jgi:hypothetical protein
MPPPCGIKDIRQPRQVEARQVSMTASYAQDEQPRRAQRTWTNIRAAGLY